MIEERRRSLVRSSNIEILTEEKSRLIARTGRISHISSIRKHGKFLFSLFVFLKAESHLHFRIVILSFFRNIEKQVVLCQSEVRNPKISGTVIFKNLLQNIRLSLIFDRLLYCPFPILRSFLYAVFRFPFSLKKGLQTPVFLDIKRILLLSDILFSCLKVRGMQEKASLLQSIRKYRCISSAIGLRLSRSYFRNGNVAVRCHDNLIEPEFTRRKHEILSCSGIFSEITSACAKIVGLSSFQPEDA